MPRGPNIVAVTEWTRLQCHVTSLQTAPQSNIPIIFNYMRYEWSKRSIISIQFGCFGQYRQVASHELSFAVI